MKIGQLEIDLLANVARLQADMNEVKRSVGGTMQYVQQTSDLARKAMGALGVSLGVGAFTVWMKSAVEAADRLDEMSQRTGVAASELSAMDLAYRQAGLSSDVMGTSLAKLAKQAAEGNSALKLLGVETRNTDGSMRGTQDMLYDVADAFQEVKGQTERVALAQELFGKSGAEMLPLLQSGSDGLREMADMSARLGLVVSNETAAAANQFNDTTELLGLSLQGVARQTMAQLLPTLNSLAGTFLTNVTESGNLTRMADALAAGLKLLYSAGVGVVQVFSSIGTTLGAAGAMIAATLDGDFEAVRQINAQAQRDVRDGWTSAFQQVKDVWTGANASMVTSAAATLAGSRSLTLTTKEQEDAMRQAAAQSAKLAQEHAKLVNAGNDALQTMARRNAALQTELDLGRSLTDGEKAMLDLEAKLSDGKLLLTASQRALAASYAQATDGLQAHIKAKQEEAKLQADMAKDRADIIDQVGKETASLQEKVDAEKEELLQLQLGDAAYRQLTITRLRDLAAQKEAIATTSDQSEELLRQAAILRERANLLQEGVALKEARAAADEWKRTTDQIENGLTDSLMRAFEAGKGYGQALRDTLVNAFKTLVLRPIIQPIVNGMGSALGGVGQGLAGLFGLGGSSGAMAGTGGGDLGSLLGLSGMGSTLGSFGATGFMSTLTGTGLGTTLGAAGSLIEGGSLLGGLGMGIGAVAPYLMAAYALYKALGSGGTPHVGAMLSMDQYGTATALAGQEKYTKAETWSAVSAIGTSALQSLNQLSKTFGGTGGYTGRFGFKADGEDAAYGYLSLINSMGQQVAGWSGTGSDWRSRMKDYQVDATKSLETYTQDVASAVRSTLGSIDMPRWAKDALNSLGSTVTLDQLNSAAAQISQTNAQLLAMSSNFGQLGGIFGRIALASSDAQYQLAQFSGGIDKLVANASSFVQAYYTTGEQQGLQAASLLAQFKALGIDVLPTTMSDFRRLVESQNIRTEDGNMRLAALLEMSSQFASVQQYLTDQGTTLADLAKLAPQGAVFSELTNAQQRQADAAAAQAELAARQASAAESTAASIVSMRDLLGSKLDDLGNLLASKLDNLRQAVQEQGY